MSKQGVQLKRRTQEERSIHTQNVLMEAARKTLCDKGYAGLTTAEVSKRAGLSRGAQLHHYASKQELMLALADHIFSAVESEIEDIARQLSDADHGVETFVTRLWEQIFSPDNYHPTTELMNAARTDPALKERLLVRWNKLLEVYHHTWVKALRRSGALTPKMESTLTMTLSLMRGLAYERLVRGDDPDYYRDILSTWSEIVSRMMHDETACTPLEVVKP